jgi:hypothetical protein
MNNRNKGKNYEIDITNLLKAIGFPKTKSSRAASKLYDDCGVDHWGAQLPDGRLILTQCKSGYEKNRPKADWEFKNQRDKIEHNFPKGSPELNPDNIQILFHKINGYHSDNHFVTLKYKDFVEIFQEFSKNKLKEN